MKSDRFRARQALFVKSAPAPDAEICHDSYRRYRRAYHAGILHGADDTISRCQPQLIGEMLGTKMLAAFASSWQGGVCVPTAIWLICLTIDMGEFVAGESY